MSSVSPRSSRPRRSAPWLTNMSKIAGSWGFRVWENTRGPLSAGSSLFAAPPAPGGDIRLGAGAQQRVNRPGGAGDGGAVQRPAGRARAQVRVGTELDDERHPLGPVHHGAGEDRVRARPAR